MGTPAKNSDRIRPSGSTDEGSIGPPPNRRQRAVKASSALHGWHGRTTNYSIRLASRLIDAQRSSLRELARRYGVRQGEAVWRAVQSALASTSAGSGSDPPDDGPLPMDVVRDARRRVGNRSRGSRCD